jgi:hypothetical protein
MAMPRIYEVLYYKWQYVNAHIYYQSGQTEHTTSFMLLILCIFLQSIYQPKTALNETQFMTSLKLLHVSAPGCYPLGDLLNEEIKVQHTNLGIY